MKIQAENTSYPWIVAAIVFVLAGVCAGGVVWRWEQYRIQEDRARVADLSLDQAHILQRNVERALSSAYALAALVREGKGDIPDFDAVATQMLPFYKGVSALQLAPGGVIRYSVPLAGNETAIGFDIFKNPTQREDAILARDSGQLTLAGPFNLVQGGMGAVGRLPVFLDTRDGQHPFWGFVSVLIRFPETLDSARLLQFKNRGVHYKLWRTDPNSGKPQVIDASSAAALVDPVDRSLEVPNATWTLSVAPVKGWSDPLGLALKAAAGLLFSLMIAYPAKLLVELDVQQKRLKSLVVERTADLAASDADLNRAQSIAHLGSWVFDFDKNHLRWSAETNRIFGMREGERINYETFLQHVHPDDRDAVDRAWQAALKGAPYDIEHRIVVGDSIRWVREHAAIERDASLAPLHCVGIVQDLTERKQVADTLLFLLKCGTPATHEDFFPSLARYLAQSLGSDYVCIDRLHGDGLAAQTVAIYFDGKFQSNVEYTLKDTPCGEAAGKAICCFQQNVRHLFPKDVVLQEMLAESYVGTTLWNSTGQPIGLIAIIGRKPLADPAMAESILQMVAGRAGGELERRQAEESLRCAKEAADTANHAKDDFLAKLSHELRTPLTPVLLATSQLLSQTDLPAATRDDLAMVQRNLDLEARLLDDLLDVSRILNGKMSLHREVIDIHQKIKETLTIVSASIQARGLHLIVDLQATHSHVDGDPARVQQAIWNLLSNAIKFTPESGHITITTANDDGHVLVHVADSGMGILPELLPRLFDAFEQGSRLTTRHYGGLGLGLTICKSVMEMHGGSISAKSQGPGHGSTFTLRFPTVTLPAATAPVPAAAPGDMVPSRTLRVLLVEDHADSARLLSRVLRSWGYEVQLAHSVASALAAASVEAFDLLISDLGLPDGSGHDLMRQLAAKGPVNAIAVSGYGTEEDVGRSKDAGFAEHLTKPVTPASLRAAIQRIIASAPA